MSFETSWTEAAKTVMRELCKATDAKENQQAFRGYEPHMLNFWTLYTGGEGGNIQTSWTPDKPVLHLNARIVGTYQKLDIAEQMAMKIVKALPMQNIDNVHCFRIRAGGFPEPQYEDVPIANTNNKRGTVLAVVWTISCDFVFTTGGV